LGGRWLEYKAFGDEDMKEWERFMDSLEEFWLNEEADKFVWAVKISPEIILQDLCTGG